MIPTEIKMADLSALEKLLPSLILQLLFARSDKNVGRQISMYRRVYIRLVDKALDEYQEARDAIVAQVEEQTRNAQDMAQSGRYMYMFQFINSMENGILTVRRILRILDAIKANKEGLSLPRTMRRHIESLTDPVVGARNMIEHLDDEIRENTVRADQSVMIKITPDQDGIMIGDRNLQFATLSVIIKQMHVLGQDMLAWR